MAATGVGRLLVISPDKPKELVGIITRSDLLKARARQVEEEMKRERFLLPGLFLRIVRRKGSPPTR
jgi:CBS-domain-containing membrane protein